MEEYLTTREIAKMLKVHVITVRRWIGFEGLPATFLIKEYRVKKTDLDNFLSLKRKKRQKI